MTHPKTTVGSIIWTVPNALCLFRIVGSGVLIALAMMEFRRAALVLLLAMLFSDWLDGKLAVLLNQQSPFGARLDSVADITMYSSVVIAFLWLSPGVIERNAIWIVLVVVSYAVSVCICLVKFRRWPSYHTLSAKVSWLAVATATLATFAGWPDIPIRAATILVSLGNCEAAAISLILRRYAVDVPSVLHALRRRRTLLLE